MGHTVGLKPELAAFVEEYLGELVEGNAAIFAGAGLSAPAGFVDWRELIRPLANELGLDIADENDLVAIAQFHVNANGRNRHKLHKAVIEALSADNPPTENHNLLAQLPISTWWTTNYDTLIEAALRKRGKIVDVKSAVPQLATTRPKRDATLFKMHGDVERPDQAVATRDDFERYPLERQAFVTALSGDLVSKTFLFLGFSFTDPNLEHVLTRVRLTFTENQRRHFAVFRKPQKAADESDERFEQRKIRQALVLEDLKRFNIKALLIDQFSEITDMLAELVARYRRRTVFISGSASDFSPWDAATVSEFSQRLGEALVRSGCRIATGFGLGIGDGLIGGALRQISKSRETIEDVLVLRPFPSASLSEPEQAVLWKEYRQELISHAGIGVFLFGNKIVDGKTTVAAGVVQEYEMARDQGLAVVAVGSTGWAAAEIADDLGENPNSLGFDPSAIGPDLVELQNVPKQLSDLVEKIVSVIKQLQSGRK